MSQTHQYLNQPHVEPLSVLVTGGTGFLGQYLCRALQLQGHQVTAFGRNTHIGKQLVSEGIQFQQGDLRDKSAVMAVCKNKHIVFHCGALSAPWGKPSDFMEINVTGARHVVDACLQHSVQRLVMTSTPSVYTILGQDRLNIKESDPLPQSMVNAYAQSKLQAESIVTEGFKNGLDTIILRPRALIGPGDTTILPRLLRVHQRFGLPWFRGGNVLMDVTPIQNVVDAHLLAMVSTHPDCVGQVIHISNGDPRPLVELMNLLMDALQRPLKRRALPESLMFGMAHCLEKTWGYFSEPSLTRYGVQVLAHHMTLDITKAKELLGYVPRVSVSKSIHEFAQWWKQHQGKLL